MIPMSDSQRKTTALMYMFGSLHVFLLLLLLLITDSTLRYCENIVSYNLVITGCKAKNMYFDIDLMQQDKKLYFVFNF